MGESSKFQKSQTIELQYTYKINNFLLIGQISKLYAQKFTGYGQHSSLLHKHTQIHYKQFALDLQYWAHKNFHWI